MTLDLEAVEARAEAIGPGAFYAARPGDGYAEMVASALTDRNALLGEVRRLRAENSELREGYARESAGAAALREKVAVMDQLLDEPRYSTEAVDALLQTRAAYSGVFSRLQGMELLLNAFDKVRASREPAK